MGGIYQIRNKINGRRYVGSTSNFVRRKSQHFTQLRDNKHSNQQLQRAYDKYGENAFIFEVLEELPKDKLIKKEQEYLNANTNGYNIAKIAGSNAEVPRTKEWLYKMSESQKGVKKSDATKKRMSEAKKGKPSVRLGKKHSEESKKKMSKQRTKKVYCVETGKEYRSRHEAAADVGVSETTILRSIKTYKTIKSIRLTFTYEVVSSVSL